MTRKLATALLVLLFAMNLLAKERAVAPPKQSDARLAGDAASVTGEVTSVNGHLIALAGGLVTIDASSSKILHDRDGALTIASVKPGMLILATVKDTGTVSTGPLVATVVAILRAADVSMIGTVQSVDLAGHQFSLLSRTIKVTADTSFENFHVKDTSRQAKPTLANLQTNMMVIVEANASGGSLVASRVTLIAPIPPRPQVASGVVKSIGAHAWVITVRDHDTTFVVNATTKIIGTPKAGDKVEVLYTVDSAHANVALSIVKAIEIPKVVKFTGTVKSLGSSQWVITGSDGKDYVLKLPEHVRLLPAVAVGDRVEVVATENTDGTYTLITIVKISR